MYTTHDTRYVTGVPDATFNLPHDTHTVFKVHEARYNTSVAVDVFAVANLGSAR